MARTPPLGIVLIAVLGVFDALISIAGGLGVAALGRMGLVVGPVLLVIGVVKLLISIGLLTLNSVAWALAMVLFGISLVLDLVTLNLLSLLITGVILLYLYSKRGLYTSGERNVASPHGL